jgi:excisionase family DNA binding protein
MEQKIPLEVARLLDAAALARALTVSQATVRAWTSRCDIPCIRIGRLVRYRLDDVLAWLATSNPSLRRPDASSDDAA